MAEEKVEGGAGEMSASGKDVTLSLAAAATKAMGVARFRLDGNLIEMNRNLMAMLGCEVSELKGMTFAGLCRGTEKSVKGSLDIWSKVTAGERAMGEFSWKVGEGSLRWLQVSCARVASESGTGEEIVVFGCDITSRFSRQLDMEARATAIDRSQAVIEFDAAGNVLEANQNFLSLTGYELAEIKGQQHRIFCSPRFVQSVEYKDFWRRLRDGEFQTGEYCRYAKDRSEFWIQATYTPVFDAAGKVVKVVKFATDVTANKVRNAEFEAQMAAVNRSQAVIEFDTTGNILEANQNFLMVTGYTHKELVGKHHRIFCDEEYAGTTEYKQFWQKLAVGEVMAGLFQRYNKEGKEFWIQASYNPVFDVEGRVKKVVKFATDVTEARMKAADHQGKVDAVNRSQAVIEFSLEGNILCANDNFLEAMGFSEREIIGKHHKIFCDPEYVKQEEYSSFWLRLGRGEYQSGRYLRYGKFGQRVWIQASYNPIFDINGKVAKIAKIATVVTKEVERENEILAKAEEMNETMGELLRAIEAIEGSTKETSRMANQSQEEAGRGNQAITEVMGAISEIEKSSVSVREMVNVIGELANQTNLLAFNAAIEQATAVRQVATLIRELAYKEQSFDAKDRLSASLSRN